MDRTHEQDSSALRRSAQAIERAAEKLEKTAEELGSPGHAEQTGRDEELDRNLTAFEEGLAETLGKVTADLFSDLSIGLDDFVSGLFGLFSHLFTAKLGIFGDLLELFLPFAEGGLVRSPTLALLGERGPEYVIPESSLNGALSSGLAGMVNLLTDMRGGASAGGGDWDLPTTGTVTTIQHIHYAPAIGSLDKLDEYSQVAGAGPKDY